MNRLDVSAQDIEKKLVSLQENELSQTVLVPLLKEVYGARVEFTGGLYEKGRDIVIYKKDELGELEPIAVQVKKISPSANSQSRSFQQLLNQLSQAQDETIIDPETSHEIAIKKVLFITPYLLEQKVIDTHRGAFSKARLIGITIVDGFKLITLLKEKAPFLLNSLLENEQLLKSYVSPKLTNSLLMKALNMGTGKKVCDIYCDIDFTFGNIRSSLDQFKTIEAKQAVKVERVSSSHFPLFCSTFKAIEASSGVDILDKDEINSAQKKFKEAESLEAEDKAVRAKISSFRREISELAAEEVFTKYNSLKIDVGAILSLIKSDEKLLIDHNFKDEDDSVLYQAVMVKIRRACSNIDVLKLQIRKIRERIDDLDASIEINLDSVAKAFNTVAKKVRESYSKRCSTDEYLLAVSGLNELISNLRGYISEFDIKPIKHVNNTKITLSDALYSEYNVLLLGDAGSGKTTNLQVHANTLYENGFEGIVFYSSLNELCQYKKNEACLFNLIASYMLDVGIQKSPQEIIESIKNQNCVIILDSIDEAISTYPWVIDSLSTFAKEIKHGKIITSSRYTVEEISELNFLSLSLCPFNEKQKEQFFNKWFADTDESRHIIEHLKNNPKLSDVVTNPLSATILATLKENNIPLPTTEASLYQKRFELLSGMFDRFKGVNRSTIQPENLLKTAQYLAFEIHKLGHRKFSREEAVIICKDYEDNYDLTPSEDVINELISPCEIIQPTNDGLFSFGHLRFQEYLASKEFGYRRGLQMYKFVSSNWWHDVVILYCQDTKSVDWILEDAIQNGYATEIKELLKSIIQFSRESQKSRFTRKLNIALVDETKSDPKYTEYLDDEIDELDYDLDY